ncbi:hypothetical protein IFR04_014647 [Cadophora malorum]|uniref:Rhodopsin domain-containing protein n=1 Tax=Cadophora malorum TaxID=108018 RepID=A0A8H7T4B8_9HELO|nr:hypothetical protein IFR04_014647 [Cadophora malorum]
MHDGLVAVKVTASLCHKLLGESRSDFFLITVVTVYASAVLFVAFRFVIKAMKRTKGRIDWSDWLLLLAILIAIPNFYNCVKGQISSQIGSELDQTWLILCLGSRNGFGKHFWELQDGQLKGILRMIYIAEVIYVIQLAVPKLSILVFYVNSIPDNGFRLAVFATMGFIILSTAIISTLSIVSCYPIPFFWDRDLKGRCLDINGVAFGIGGLSIVQDVIIIALPIPILRGMRLPWKEKIIVLLMLAAGSSTVLISVLRVRSIVGYGNSNDPSWDYVVITTWSIYEVYVTIITASLPAVRSLLVYLFPQYFAVRSTNQSEDTPDNVSWLRRPGRLVTKAPQISTLQLSTNRFSVRDDHARSWQRIDEAA